MEEISGKNLIQSCIGYLNEMLEPDSDGNRALYPVIMVFFGKGSVEHFPTVRDTLDINWETDSAFLKYVNIIKTEDGFSCVNLVTGEKSDEKGPYDFLENAVSQMRGENRAFPDKTRTRFEYILLGEDEDGIPYYDFMINMDLGTHYKIFKTMFLMINERGSENRARIHQLLSYITENREKTKDKLGTIYLLSNYLRNGFILQEHNLNLNYRLVADLILMGGNQGTDPTNKALTTVENYDTIKTAAYALVEKPVRGITVFSLQKIMDFLMEENERDYKSSAGDSMKSADAILNKLEIQRGKIQCLEDIFRDSVLKIFPAPQEIQYLAFINEQEYKNIYKEKRVSTQRLNRATGGNWELFFQENYYDKMDSLLSDDHFISDCMARIEKDWRAKLSYGDALYGLEDNRVMDNLENLSVASSVPQGKSLEENLHFWAVEEARKQFYSHMIQLLSRLLTEIHQDARRFVETYSQLQERIKREAVDDKEKNIRGYYEHLVESFLRQDGGQISASIFKLKNDETAIIQALAAGFKKLISNPKNDKEYAIYKMSFEKEIDTRLSTMPPDQRKLMILENLEVDIASMVRLHGISTDYLNRPKGTYYLVKKDMAFVGHLPKEGHFHLNRTDCTEKIAIYDLDSEDKYCNLLEMVGEV